MLRTVFDIIHLIWFKPRHLVFAGHLPGRATEPLPTGDDDTRWGRNDDNYSTGSRGDRPICSRSGRFIRYSVSVHQLARQRLLPRLQLEAQHPGTVTRRAIRQRPRAFYDFNHSDGDGSNGNISDQDGNNGVCASKATGGTIVRHRTCEIPNWWPDDCGNWQAT